MAFSFLLMLIGAAIISILIIGVIIMAVVMRK